MATDDSADMPESEEGTPTASETSRSGKKARGGGSKKSVAPLKIKLNKRKKKRNSSVS